MKQREYLVKQREIMKSGENDGASITSSEYIPLFVLCSKLLLKWHVKITWKKSGKSGNCGMQISCGQKKQIIKIDSKISNKLFGKHQLASSDKKCRKLPPKFFVNRKTFVLKPNRNWIIRPRMKGFSSPEKFSAQPASIPRPRLFGYLHTPDPNILTRNQE